MSRTGLFVGIALLVAVSVTASYAQTPAPAAPASTAAQRPHDRSELRRHIYVMEGALVRAVSFGAQRLNREIRSVAPEMVALSGEPQARGVYLDGYGIYFDVGVPILHQSMMWSLRTMLGQDDQALVEAFNMLKSKAKADPNPTSRAAFENAISRLEMQVGPLAKANAPASDAFQGTNRQVVGASMVSPDAPVAPVNGQEAAPTPKIDRKYFLDPNAINRAYTDAVQNALIDAMLDYSPPMSIHPDEYLTVAARDNMQRDTLAPLDPTEEVVTILYKIRGADLLAYRAGQIDRTEIRKRIQILEF